MKNWVFSLFNFEFTKQDFTFFLIQLECYEDENYLDLETIDAVIHLSIGKGYLVLHIMGFDIIAY